MPSLRKPLSIRQKLIALYTDPNSYALADVVAGCLGARPGSADYRRHVTCFLLDVEARIHTNRLKTDRHLDDKELYNLRRDLAFQVTGRDVLLAQPPTADVVRRWRYRFLPTEKMLEQAKADNKPVLDVEARLAGFVTEYEQLAMKRATQLGQFPRGKDRNLAELAPEYMACADGTYLRAHSKVLQTIDPVDGRDLYLGSRSKRNAQGIATNPRVQRVVHREPKADRETMGVNHVAILTPTRFGRVILSVEQALGGEVHAALKAMQRIAALADGGIRGLAYDKAMEGWQIDWLLAHTGIVAVAPPKADEGKDARVEEAEKAAEAILAARASAQAAADAARPCEGGRGRKKKTKNTPAPSRAVRAAVAGKILNRLYDADQLVAEAQAGKPLGAGLPLGTSVYLNSHGNAVAVKSQHQYLENASHDVGREKCVHRLHVDDGALWDVRTELGQPIKDQRLVCTTAETVRNERTGCYELRASHRFVCEYTGEVVTHETWSRPSGTWRPEEETRPRKRSARQNMMLLAPCDPLWRRIYALRGGCESWFSYLKQQLLDDKRAPSLDLNHQLLDVLYAGILTNAITLFHARREGHH